MLNAILIVATATAGIVDIEIGAPTGWSKTREGDTVVYTPGDLQSGETYRVTVYPARPIEGKAVADWLVDFAKADSSGSAPKVEKNTAETVVVSRAFNGPDGSTQAYLYTASGTGDPVRVVRVTMSLTTKVFPRYKEATNLLVREAVGKSGGATASARTSPVKGGTGKMMIGGKLEPGMYVGKQYSGKELRTTMRVYIYPNGEYRVTDGNDKDFRYNTGTYQYDPKTGRLSIDRSFDLENSRIAMDTDFCFFARMKNGTPMIYAENDHGFSTYRTTLIYAGAPKRPSPNAEKVAKQRADAEAARYKFVTAPGKGVQPGQIAAIAHEYEVQMYSAGASGMGTNTTDEAYLLLKDGTVHKGLPVPPDMLDVALSRQKEPKTWGRWRQVGKGYQVSWAGGPYLKLNADSVIPARPGEQLAGRFGTGSSSASLAGSSYRLWGVTFTKSGRFKKDNRGGSGNSTFMQQGGAPSINSSYDDKGSVTSATGGDFTVMSKNKKNPDGDREGTYSISGYTMTLHYDNGTVARMPFFYTLPDKSAIWFEGNQLALGSGKD